MNDFPVLGYDLAAYILPAALMVAVALGLVCAKLWRRAVSQRRDKWDDDGLGWGIGLILSGTAVVFLIVAIAVSAIPFQARYWTWYRVDAHVSAVSNTLRDASGDLTTTPVVTVEGLDRPVVVSDPRIVTMAGDDVTLSCKPTWHFRAADSYTCRIYEYVGSN